MRTITRIRENMDEPTEYEKVSSLDDILMKFGEPKEEIRYRFTEGFNGI